MNPEPSKTHKNNRRDRFDRHRGNRHQSFSHGCNYSPLPYKRVRRRQMFSESERKRSGGCIYSRPLRSAESQDHQESPTNRDDDSNFKTLLLNMIIKNLHPLKTVTGFQDLASSLHPSLNINESSIQTELQSIYRQKRLEVQNAINAGSNLVLSAELWSSDKTVFYLTVSCHLINKNWMQKSYVLDTAHLLIERTTEHVVKQLMRISNEWNITEKIQVVVTNIDDMKKVDKSICQWTFIPCFARTLDKVFRETIGDSGWKHLLGKCQQIVSFFHQNPKASESLQKHRSHLKLQKNDLIQSSDLRWLHTLHMLQNILELWPAIFKVFIDFLEEKLCLNENERKILKDILAVLKILKKVTEEMGSQGYSPISMIIPLVQRLQEELRKLEMGNEIAKTLSAKCDHHIGNIKQNYWFRVSTALDPRYKTCVMDSNIGVKAEIQSLIKGNRHTTHSSYDTRREEMILEKHLTQIQRIHLISGGAELSLNNWRQSPANTSQWSPLQSQLNVCIS
ncbi:zinc finger BED domain-containing protein 4-like [Paramisgurnus dabryanus]|uniref:zinc finger BED domain-containing protein 4-like n=1 Tax=Paramisgurnus dabryanus TaxID=90735 RepID=UPI003CCFD055